VGLGKEDYRLLFLRYIRGLPPADIAMETGLTANAVSVQLHRALKRLSKSPIRKPTASVQVRKN
jgi:DNA-directed RNA polymerase specialized sigma24 family protein